MGRPMGLSDPQRYGVSDPMGLRDPQRYGAPYGAE